MPLPPASEVLDELLTQLMVFVRPPDWEGPSLDLRDAIGRRAVPPDDVPENRGVVDGAGFTFSARGRSPDLAGRLRFLIANPSVREAAR
jgi:hypothetical protein